MKTRGFTLIELLVVIAIVSFLASIMFASFSTARAQARTARRLQDIQEVQKALELYRAQNGHYPISTQPNGQIGAVCWECGNDTYYDADKLSSELGPYLSTLPTDPQLSSARFAEPDRGYWYQSDGQDYKFVNVNYNESSLFLPANFEDEAFVTPTNGRRSASGRSSDAAKNWSPTCIEDCPDPNATHTVTISGNGLLWANLNNVIVGSNPPQSYPAQAPPETPITLAVNAGESVSVSFFPINPNFTFTLTVDGVPQALWYSLSLSDVTADHNVVLTAN